MDDQNSKDDGLDIFDIKTDDSYFVNLTHKQANLIATQDLRGYYGSYSVTILVSYELLIRGLSY